MDGNAKLTHLTCPPCNKYYWFRRTVLEYLAQHSLILNELLRTSRRVHQEVLIPPEHVPQFPIQTLEEFQHFNIQLGHNGPLNDYMIARLASVGGSGIESLTRRILKFLISNEVAILYNWKGRDKLSFEQTTVMNVIYEAAKVNFPSSEKNDLVVANSVKLWLKFAKARMMNSHKKLANWSEVEVKVYDCNPEGTSGSCTGEFLGLYWCSVCVKSYKHKQSLNNHKKFECGKAPSFYCGQCPYQAKRKSHLTRHMKTHVKRPKSSALA
ncbi:hypothetical protein MTP99_008537 [Tenebrio molitor]|nr:hypothetical protein MTP99_008537 [Tenebrio molitor]